MSLARCQVCGRHLALNKDGGIRRHYFKGRTCYGTYAAPWLHSSKALEETLFHWKQMARAFELLHRACVDGARPFDSYSEWLAAEREAARLERRLRNCRRLMAARPETAS